MRKLLFALVVPAFLSMPAFAAAGELKLTMNGGLVTLVAEDVPLSSVLAEWARIGKTKIVNGEQIFTKVTLHIVDTPERKALDILLRSAAGYMAAERQVTMAGASAFDRIMILPTSRPPATSGAIVSTPPPQFPRPSPQIPTIEDDPVSNVMPPGSGPVSNQPGVQGPPTGPQPGPPTGPQSPQLTAPRPGQLPAPGPQQPVPFGSPTRPPGAPTGPGGGAPMPSLPGGPGGPGGGGSGGQF